MENNKLLYQTLNEKRTRGEWNVQILFDKAEIKSSYLGLFVAECKDDIDASYICLAVNNFHMLAETLEKINGMCADACSEDGVKINVGKVAKMSMDALNSINKCKLTLTL